MTTLLLIRHGQSLANIQKYFAGNMDAPLTELGHRQARATAEYVQSHYRVDAVYASDLSRAWDTGKAVADLTGAPILSNRNLREIYAGAWEGLSFDELTLRFPQSYGIWRTDIGNAAPEEGETVAALQNRVVEAIRSIAKAHPHQVIVIATHATPIRVLQCHCSRLPLDQMKDIPWVTNASLTVMTYDQGQFQQQLVSYDRHLGTMTSSLPPNV